MDMKSVLVTGAYGGMGRATVKALVAQGCRVFALDKVVGEPEDNVIPIKADITDSDSVAQAYKTVQMMTDSLQAIVHFAGMYMLDSLVEMEDAEFERIFRINLFGAFYINKAFLPLLKRGSRILITTSELAPLDPLPFTGVYAVTKGALDKYAYSLAMELQLLGVGVSVLRAGAVTTGMLGASTDALDRFCDKTGMYSPNAARFRKIVNRVEARSVAPEKVAAKVLRILGRRRPGFAYSINRNPLLLLLNVLPKAIQMWAIRQVLK